MKILIYVIALTYVNVIGASPQLNVRQNGGAAKAETVEASDVPDNIGTATMLKDRTIVLSLIYWFPEGGGHTTPTAARFNPRHPKYKEILRHLGGMSPGEVKGVKPWPTTGDVPTPNFDRPLPPEFKDFPLPETNPLSK